MDDKGSQLLALELDDLYTEGYFYTQFDEGGYGHRIIIRRENREAFLDAFAAEFRKRADNMLEEWEEDEEDEEDEE